MDTSRREQEIYSIREGDIFLTRTSEKVDELGMSCVALGDRPNATYSGFLKRLRPKQCGCPDPKFMAFYLRSSLFRQTMTNNAVMVLRASLNKQIFSYLELLLPDLDQQTRIGDFLYQIDAKIELNQLINAELEALAKTIYDYWFVQFDFPDENGRPYKSSGGVMQWNNTLRRNIPVTWRVDIVGNCIDKPPQVSKVPASAVQKNGSIPVIDQSANFVCGFTDDVAAEIKVDKPHIVFGDHTRVLKLVNFNYARGADGTQVLVANSKNMPPFTLFHTIEKIDLSNYGYARHFKFLKDISVVVPDESVAALFERTVTPWYSKIDQNREQNRLLTGLRDWLLPMLMNGQVRVT